MNTLVAAGVLVLPCDKQRRNEGWINPSVMYGDLYSHTTTQGICLGVAGHPEIAWYSEVVGRMPEASAFKGSIEERALYASGDPGLVGGDDGVDIGSWC